MSSSITKLEEIIKEKNKDVECNIVADGIGTEYLGEQFGIFSTKTRVLLKGSHTTYETGYIKEAT